MNRIGFVFLIGILTQGLSAQIPADSIFNGRNEIYFRIARPVDISMHDLSKLFSIDKVRSDSIFGYANRKEYTLISLRDLQPAVLTPPSLLYKLEMSANGKGLNSWDAYPTYDAYVQMMQNWALGFPGICKLDTIGTSVEGRLLLALEISNHASVPPVKPQVLYTSSMHGDETTGYLLMLHLIDTLLNSYGTSPFIARLVDSLDIVINPLSNPDGTYYGGNATVSGATRGNANAVDLNRNYPDPQDGDHPDGNAWQPENIAMMNFMKDRHFSLSANFHGGSEVMNYPWDTWFKRHPDENWFQLISHQFADSAQKYGSPGYFTDVTSTGVTDGYDWYTISGGRQDYVTYFLSGREITIEISSIKTPPGYFLPQYWEATRRSLLNYLDQARYGLYGKVTDELTGEPIKSHIEVLDHDLADAGSTVYSDSLTGAYVRYLAAGNWNLVFSAAGYDPDTIRGVQLANFQLTRLNVALKPEGSGVQTIPAFFQCLRVWPVPADNQLNVNPGNTRAAMLDLQIFDLSGRMMLHENRFCNSGNESLKLSTSTLPAGLYLLKVSIQGMLPVSRLFSVMH